MFVWNEKERPRGTVAREHMYRRELEDHAGLLLRLGRTPTEVKARLRSNVAWDFQIGPRPDHAAEVDRIVDGVVRRTTPR